MELKTCKNCGPQEMVLWATVMKRGKVTFRCIECTRKSNRGSYASNTENRKQNARSWREKNGDRKRGTDHKWREENAEHRRAYMKALSWERKKTVLLHYGDRCACCGEKDLHFLCLDHIAGGGNKHRSEVGRGSSFYGWVVKNDFPAGFRVLCHNCNFAVGAYGSCPHTNATVSGE